MPRYFTLNVQRQIGLSGSLEEAIVTYLVPALAQLCEVVVAKLHLQQTEKHCEIAYDVAAYALQKGALWDPMEISSKY